MEEIQNYNELNETIEKEKKKKNKKKEKRNNNIDDIEHQLKLEYKKEEIKKNKDYNKLIEFKKEENLINLNIQYFENLLMKLKYNE